MIDGRIVGIGRESDGPPPIDLGDVAILPGLVNAHVHLEFSDLSAPLGVPNMRFPEWIRSVVEHRGTTDRDPLKAVVDGLDESLRSGTTTLGEIATGEWSSAPFEASPLDCTIFQELIAIAAEHFDDRLRVAQQHIERDPRCKSVVAGISPHAPYTVHPELFKRLVRLAKNTRVPLAMHLAESPEELELLATGTGLFVELLDERGHWNPEAIPRGTRPLDYLRTMTDAPKSLVIHGNYLDEEEIAFVGSHADKMSVVYCPRTHKFFGHPTHPLEKLLACGAKVALGTDGRSSNPDLSLLEEMRTVARRFPSLDPAEILRLGTLGGAQALGCEARCGSLEVGKQADMTIVPIGSTQADNPYDLLFDSDVSAIGTMIRGQFVHRSGMLADLQR